jgi:hypothetical protein
MSYIQGFEMLVLPGNWNHQFRIKDFKIEHVAPVGRMLERLESAFYASDFKAEFLVAPDHTISFVLYTDEAEISEYVNRIFVPAS